MNTGKSIAPHETLVLQEILSFKNLCATKAVSMEMLVKDEELKSMMQEDFNISQGHIRELQSLLQSSSWVSGSSKNTGM